MPSRPSSGARRWSAALARWGGSVSAAALLATSSWGCAATIQVDGARALRRVERQVAFGPRIPGTPEHRAMQDWLVAELERLGGRVERQSFRDSLPSGPLEVTNIIARFGPASGRRIALCAHYDTRPWADQDPDSTRRREPVAGANDGGSGVAVLLEVAERMAVQAPRVAVDLVFFDAEDQGRPAQPDEYSLGARGYARRLETAERPAGAFVFDMVGDKDLAIHTELYSLERAANLVALVDEAARATKASHFHSTPLHRVIDDHLPLLAAGIPAVDIIDFEYPAWHTHADLPDQVSAESLAEVARVAVWLVYESALARSR
jgi:hypothetical protein